jgi:DNA replication protein DnaC
MTLDTANTVPCGNCGTSVSRQPYDGPFDRIYRSLSLLCPTCSDAEDERILAEQQVEEARHTAKKLQRRLSSSGLPLQLQTRGIRDLDPTDRHNVFAAATRWAAGELPGLLLTGPVGTGKTVTAAAAVVDRIQRDQRVAWVSAYRLIADLQAPFDSDDRHRALALSDRDGPPLALDDIDKARPSEFGAEAIFALIDSCDANGRALIVTSNLRLGELAAKWPAPWGESIASRLHGMCTAFDLTGRDRRGAA